MSSMAPRRLSPLNGKKPTKADLAAVDTANPHGVDHILPADKRRLKLLIVGINPGLWTAAVNAPFANPSNRFWPSLFRAGLTSRLVEAATGLDSEDGEDLITRGIGCTNLVGRPTARADQLSREELRAGGCRLLEAVERYRPRVVAVAGITAFRTAFQLPHAAIGRQDAAEVPGWPPAVTLWVVPQPSGLNAHETIDSLAEYWRLVWQDANRGEDRALSTQVGNALER